MIVFMCEMCGNVFTENGQMTDIKISHAGSSKINYPRNGNYQICKKCEAKLLTMLECPKDQGKRSDYNVSK